LHALKKDQMLTMTAMENLHDSKRSLKVKNEAPGDRLKRKSQQRAQYAPRFDSVAS
jgi:hypothetical protein